MKRLGMGSLTLVLCLVAQRGSAQDLQWRPVAAVRSAPPLVTLGRPEPVETPAGAVIQQTAHEAPAADAGWMVRGQAADPLFGPAQFTPPPPPAPPPGPVTAQPYGGSPFAPAPGAMPPPPPPPNGPNLADANENYLCGVKANSSGGPTFLENCRDSITGIGDTFKGDTSRQFLQSDHAFDNFISPLSNPFFFEDPRALTEIRPLLLYQHVPGSNYAFQGGDVWFYGLQGRLALTDMFSLVVDKLGFVSTRPQDTVNGFTSSTGFAEFSLGPKFTFLRLDSCKTLLAAGLKFDMAIGSDTVHQDVGDVSLVPYVSFAQCLGKTDWGTFNFMNTTGYSFAVDSKRSDFFYSSFHVDMDVMNLNKIFPLIELSWFHYTNNGGQGQFFGFEGADLFNLGSGGVAGHNNLILALGTRYKFAEWFQIGLGVELPLISPKDMEEYRLTMDLIFRY
jgi:hypothetical protein